MKCKHCGQEIKKRTNFDLLKKYDRKEDVDALFERLCINKKCPVKKFCGGERCLLGGLAEWLFAEAKI